MGTKMDIATFAKEIKRNNDNDKRWSIIMFIAFLCSGFVGIESEGAEIGSVGAGVMESVTVLFFSKHYLNQYLSIKQNIGFGIAENEYLYKIARTQAFPVKEYFNFITKKLLIWQMIILIYSVVMAIIDKKYTGIISGFIMAMIPLGVSFIVQKMFEYRISHRVSGVADGLLGFLKGVSGIVEVVILFIYLITGFMIVWAICTDVFEKELNENEIVYRSFEDETIFTVMVVVFVIFVSTCMLDLKKKPVFTRILAGSIVAVVGIIGIISERNNYTDITLDKITVASSEEKKEYRFDEIKSFEVFCHNDSIQVRLYFNDENDILLFSGMGTSTEAYDEKYYSEYNFVADLVAKFLDYGIEGKMRDAGKLQNSVEGYDEKVKDGLGEIIELLDGI